MWGWDSISDRTSDDTRMSTSAPKEDLPPTIASETNDEGTQQESWSTTKTLTYWAFVILGIGGLSPWNTIISAADYWSLVYPDIPAEMYFGMSYNPTNLIMLCLVILYGHNFSYRVRVAPCLVGFFATLIIISTVDVFAMSVLLCAILGLLDATYFGSVFALAAAADPVYCAALMQGQGFSGIIASILRITSKAVIPQTCDGIRESSTIFFGMACFLAVVAMGAYVYLEYSPETMMLVGDVHVSNRGHDSLRSLDLGNVVEQWRSDGSDSTGVAPEDMELVQVMRLTWRTALSLFLIFFVTLALFPGITAEIRSRDAYMDESGWFPVTVIATFMVGDLIGRSMPVYWRWGTQYSLLVVSTARLLFIPVFMFMLAGSLKSDTMVYVVMFLFAISNGYYATMCMVLSAESVPEALKELTETTMLLFLTLGLLVGAYFALAVEGMACSLLYETTTNNMPFCTHKPEFKCVKSI